MSEMREYQQRMLESENRLVLCDWGRAKGKTSSIAEFIINKVGFNRPIKVLVGCKYDNRAISSLLHDELENLTRENEFLEVIGRGFEKIIISSERCGKKYNLVDISIVSNIENSRGMKVDYVFCDEYIPSSNELSVFYSMGAKQVYSLGTYDIDYISDKEEVKDRTEWIDKEINKLMSEFSSIPNAENTTKRREVILCMIQKLGGLVK